MHELLESGPITHELQDGITAALELLDDLGDNLATFQAKLRHMRRDIESASALFGVTGWGRWRGALAAGRGVVWHAP